jgi:hypothetical protein
MGDLGKDALIGVYESERRNHHSQQGKTRPRELLQFVPLLFQLLPRFTRCEALDRSPLPVVARSGGTANCTAQAFA